MKPTLEASYEIHTPKMDNPRVVITGLIKQYTDEELLADLRAQNSFINDEDSLKITYSRQARYNNTWIHYLDVPGVTFNKIANRSSHVGWTLHKCADNYKVMQCVNCHNYNHKTKDCTLTKLCRNCPENHDARECNNEIPTCVNCNFIKEKYNQDISVDHSATDKKCPQYIKRLEQIKERINYNSTTLVK